MSSLAGSLLFSGHRERRVCGGNKEGANRPAPQHRTRSFRFPQTVPHRLLSANVVSCRRATGGRRESSPRFESGGGRRRASFASATSQHARFADQLRAAFGPRPARRAQRLHSGGGGKEKKDGTTRSSFTG